MFKHIAIVTACVVNGLEEMFEHFREKAFERGKPIEHADALGFVEPNALCFVKMCRKFIEQVVLLGGEITLIEVIADDERLKRHTFKIGFKSAVFANLRDTYRHRRHVVEPVERMRGLLHLFNREDKFLLAELAEPVVAVFVKDLKS